MVPLFYGHPPKKAEEKAKYHVYFISCQGRCQEGKPMQKRPPKIFRPGRKNGKKNAARTPGGTDCGKTDLAREEVCFPPHQSVKTGEPSAWAGNLSSTWSIQPTMAKRGTGAAARRRPLQNSEKWLLTLFRSALPPGHQAAQGIIWRKHGRRSGRSPDGNRSTDWWFSGGYNNRWRRR